MTYLELCYLLTGIAVGIAFGWLFHDYMPAAWLAWWRDEG